MPAADPPHRPPPGAGAVDRAAMLELAITDEPRLRVDLRELERHARDPARRSYSIDTVRELRRQLGDDVPIALLVGADSFIGLSTWKDWRSLFDEVSFVVAQRPGSSLADALPVALEDEIAQRRIDSAHALRSSPAGKVLELCQPLHAESASDLRQRIAAGRPWRHLLPPAVADYIAAHGLYAGPDHPASP